MSEKTMRELGNYPAYSLTIPAKLVERAEADLRAQNNLNAIRIEDAAWLWALAGITWGPNCLTPNSPVEEGGRPGKSRPE